MILPMLPSIILWMFLSPVPILSAMALPSLGPASAPPSLSKRCTNNLLNPSFESGIDPWLAMVSGSWSTRGVYTAAGGGHHGANFYYANSNSSVDASLTVSQSDIRIPGSPNQQVECAAWVASNRPGNVGATRVEVFLDGLSCGARYLGTTGWTRVGGAASLAGPADTPHTLAVVVTSDEAAEAGWQVWIDDLWVGTGC